jgi:hypothetical protein
MLLVIREIEVQNLPHTERLLTSNWFLSEETLVKGLNQSERWIPTGNRS